MSNNNRSGTIHSKILGFQRLHFTENDLSSISSSAILCEENEFKRSGQHYSKQQNTGKGVQQSKSDSLHCIPALYSHKTEATNNQLDYLSCYRTNKKEIFSIVLFFKRHVKNL